MNEDKLKSLFKSAQQEPPATPGPGFDYRVLARIRRESSPRPLSLFEQLNELFPRFAAGAALVIGLCFAADFYFSEADQPNIASGVAQISEDWLFANKGF